MKYKVNLINSIVMPITIIIFMAVGFGHKADAKSTSMFSITDFKYQPNVEHEIGYKQIDRVKALETFFDKYNSPLKANAETFVQIADAYGMDYRLLPSISCLESTCGKFLIEGTYNPFGWGIYGNNYIAFESYDEAISVVGKGLNDNYISRGFDTIEKIAPIYTPPNSQHWASGVRFFSNEIAAVAVSL